MLAIDVPGYELYDEVSNLFISRPAVTLQLEHSLLSMSKWESKWKIPFMRDGEKTPEQFLDYIRCMTINSKIDPMVYSRLTSADFQRIRTYINDSMTATTFRSEQNNRLGRHEVVTTELVYYWMVQAGIPFDAEKWHYNRLITLIRIYNVKNSNEKMSKKDIYKNNRAINQARRAKYGSKG